jgi:hypothetical protein
MDFPRIPDSKLQGISQRGNGFSRIEHAEAVAQKLPGSELIQAEQGLYYIHQAPDHSEIALQAQSKGIEVLEFVDSKNVRLHLNSPEGIQGVGSLVPRTALTGKAQAGNHFKNFTDAESVAKQLAQPTAIVEKNGNYFLHQISEGDCNKLKAGDNSLLDKRVVALAQAGSTRYNWGYHSSSETSQAGFATVSQGKIMLDGQEFKMAGLNVYDLADIAAKNPAELKKTLKTLADSGANTVRFWAFSKYPPEVFEKILDASQEQGLKLKFVPVLGNHWPDMEAKHSAQTKDKNWYQKGYQTEYLPHLEKTVKSLMHRPEILMWELMNEPESNHQALRQFADRASSRIRELYHEQDHSNGQPQAQHLISLGTLGGTIRPGMMGHDFKDLYALPNLDVVTAHDYTYDSWGSPGNDISGTFKGYLDYARQLNKPFFLGEIGVKVRKEGVEKNPNQEKLRSSEQAMAIMHERLKTYQKQEGFSGALLWGPQPLGHAVDGAGFGFSFDSDSANNQKLQAIFKDLAE